MEIQQFPLNCENIFSDSDLERNLDEEIDIVFNSVKDLMLKYMMYSKTSESKVVSGGLQQFLIRKMRNKKGKRREEHNISSVHYSKNDGTSFICNSSQTGYEKLINRNWSGLSCFNYMPVGVKLNIFAYLPPIDLANICSVCQEWNNLASDNVLWHHRLDWDLPKWETLSFATNPQIYQEVNSEWTYKDIYYKCSPEINKSWKKLNSTFHQVSNMLKYFLPKKTPRVAIFGPGLETSTHKLVRKLLYEDNDKFSRIAMFPGQFDGVGAGMTLKLRTSSTFHLTVLYSGTEQERENRNKNNQTRQSRLFKHQDGETGEIELQPAVKNLCHILDAFIFVVDASQTEEIVKNGLPEFNAMINERWSAPHVPVVILSCVSDQSAFKTRLPACKIVELLELVNLDRRWLVHNCTIDNLEGIHLAMEWMVEHSQNK